jgi:hypothetical protein
MLDIKSDPLAQSRDLLLQGDDGGTQEGLQQVRVQQAQFLAQPVAAGNGLLNIKALGGAGVEHEVKAQLDDEQGMLEQEAAQLAGVSKVFVLTEKTRL